MTYLHKTDTIVFPIPAHSQPNQISSLWHQLNYPICQRHLYSNWSALLRVSWSIDNDDKQENIINVSGTDGNEVGFGLFAGAVRGEHNQGVSIVISNIPYSLFTTVFFF